MYNKKVGEVEMTNWIQEGWLVCIDDRDRQLFFFSNYLLDKCNIISNPQQGIYFSSDLVLFARLLECIFIDELNISYHKYNKHFFICDFQFIEKEKRWQTP